MSPASVPTKREEDKAEARGNEGETEAARKAQADTRGEDDDARAQPKEEDASTDMEIDELEEEGEDDEWGD